MSLTHDCRVQVRFARRPGFSHMESVHWIFKRGLDESRSSAIQSRTYNSSCLGLSRPLLAQKPEAAADANRHYFFKNPTFEMIFLTSLGRAYHSGGNVGKVLYLTKQVEDGNFQSAYLAFKQAGDEARQLAEDSLVHGHKESARQAYLWAQNFYDSATYFIDGSEDPSRFLPPGNFCTTAG